ncbi:MAG: class I SAM-dependent methyltransferase [Aquificae bacterium]|nr:class I SAM-dependent methyltransferase [Aquificota bacterium]
MPKIEPFERFTNRYDIWFKKHKYAYLSQLKAVDRLLPKDREKCIEIGVGTGRFAKPLGIKYGLEPSPKMTKLAKKRGLTVYKGVAEDLPFGDKTFDCILIVTTICFVDDVKKSLEEAYRVLTEEGYIVIGFIDKNSKLGRYYQSIKEENPFYKEANFVTPKELISVLSEVGFKQFDIVQTIFKDLENIEQIEPIKEGYGKGSFVVIRAKKK